MVVFGLAAVAAVVASVVVLVRPPTFGTVALQDRRPPPAGVYSHDPVAVFVAPTPDVPIPYTPPCKAFAGTRPIGGVAFTERVTEALAQLCTLRGPSVPPDVVAAARGLAGTTIRIAEFERSGIEATLDFGSRTIWVNLKLTQRRSDAAGLIPVLLHEGAHLAAPDEPITAERELAARRVELEACRQFIRVADWPRWCEDARDLTALERADALALLASAGYAREVSSDA
jgi:hypothetical protein